MRLIVPVALLSALLAVPAAFAQHPAGRSGSFSGGHMGASSGRSFSGPSGHSFGGPGRMPSFPMRSFTSAPRMSFNAPNRAFAPQSSWRGGNDGRGWGDRGGHDRGGRYRSPYRGYGYGYGAYPYAYANSWELLPWDLGYPDFTGEDEQDNSDTAAQQQPAAEAPPADGDYRPQYGQPDEGPSYEAYAPPPPDYYGRPASTAPLAPEPQLTLIFRDGHQESIQNYALTPHSVIVMDQPVAGRQQRIPLADLNLPATEQAAQQAGLDFSPPA